MYPVTIGVSGAPWGSGACRWRLVDRRSEDEHQRLAPHLADERIVPIFPLLPRRHGDLNRLTEAGLSSIGGVNVLARWVSYHENVHIGGSGAFDAVPASRP